MKLTAPDRAELCRRLDLSQLMQRDGVEVRRNGNAWLCKLRPDERTASCHLYPPGVGKRGADGWTWHDYGSGKGGDALAYLVDIRGLSFADAMADACAWTGWKPESWQPEAPGSPRTAPKPPTLTQPAPKPAGPPSLPHDKQLDAALFFELELHYIDPEAAPKGEAYLASRGCLPVDRPVGAWMLEPETCRALAETLAAGPHANLMRRAGILKPKKTGERPRLAWWDKTCLLGCHDAEGGLAYLVGRRIDWTPADTCGKYINQSCRQGAARWPFGLPSLYAAAVAAAPGNYGLLSFYAAARRMTGRGWTPARRDVLLVEGPLDALGARVLGWPAVALLNRPQAHDYQDKHGAAALMLTPHLPALRDLPRVVVVPDADPGEKGQTGEALAARLAAWLTAKGCRADVATLRELCPDAPPECKDLADVAATRKDETP